MGNNLVCWHCGASVAEHPLPLSRYARCRACDADLYVCRMCSHYDGQRAVGCREERAEPVRDPKTPNFCDWFEPRPDAFGGDAHATQRQRAILESLFDGGVEPLPPEDPVRNALDELFRK